MAGHLPCIIWEGGVGNHGYGHVRRDGVLLLAHRLAWEDAHGPIPPGFVIHHTCANRRCVRVEHLACMSRADHTRLHGKPMKDSCKWGHDLTAAGSRAADGSCRACRNRRVREHYHRDGKAKRDARLGITPRS